MGVSDAENSRDALAKNVYGGLFDWLVGRVNAEVSSSDPSSGGPSSAAGESRPFIGVLDIFGFESFAYNSFEQLCINYSNETLQQHFNKFVFKHDQALYKAEGIMWDFIAFPDNQDTINLLEHKQTGVFSICDDQVWFLCSSPNACLDS